MKSVKHRLNYSSIQGFDSVTLYPFIQNLYYKIHLHWYFDFEHPGLTK